MGVFNVQLALKKLQVFRLSAQRNLWASAAKRRMDVEKPRVSAGQNAKQGYVKTTQELQQLVPWVAGSVAGAIGATITPIAAGPVLAMFGFSAVGPVAGTLAASIQAGIGSVSAESLFALAQSIATGGAVPLWVVIVNGIIAGGATLVAALLILKYIRYRRARARVCHSDRSKLVAKL